MDFNKIEKILLFFHNSKLLLLIFTFVLIVPLFLNSLLFIDLGGHDEGRVAGIAKEMAINNHFFIPTLNGIPFLEKPPLYHLLARASFKLFGKIDEFSVRFPSFISALVSCIIIYFWGTFLLNPRAGFLSSLILATTINFFEVSHQALTDAPLTASILSALFFFWLGERFKEKRGKYRILSLIFIVLAFYSKGFIGVFWVGSIIITYLLFLKRFKETFFILIFGIIGIVLGTLPWFLALWIKGGTWFLKFFLIVNHLGRFLGGNLGHSHSIFFYLKHFFTPFLPWTPFFLIGLYHLIKNRNKNDNNILFLVLCLIVPLILLSLASTKRELYLVPLSPFIALITSLYLIKGEGKLLKVFLFLWAIILMILTLSSPFFIFWLSHSFNTGFLIVFFSGIFLVSIIFFMLKKKNFLYLIDISLIFLSPLIFGYASVISPILNEKFSIKPFLLKAKSIISSEDQLLGFHIQERDQGRIPFYLDRTFINLKTPNKVVFLMNKNKRSFIFVRAYHIKEFLERVSAIPTSPKLYLLLSFKPENKKQGYFLLSNKRN